MLTRGKASKAEIDAFFRLAIAYAGDDCLLWPFGRTAAGYGMIRRDGKRLYVHRILCRISHGAAPRGRPFAGRSCGNRGCVNPRHLRWVAHARRPLTRQQV